jgi:hypothetical protein
MGVDVVVVVVVHGGVEGKQGQEERRQKAEQTRTVILQDMSRSRLGRYMVLGSRTDLFNASHQYLLSFEI